MNQLTATISTSDALLLQQLSEAGEEEVNDIVEELREPRGRIMQQLTALKRRGLVHMYNKYGEIIITLTSQGRQAIHYLWPEAYA